MAENFNLKVLDTSKSDVEILEILPSTLFEKVQGNKTFIAKIIHDAVQLRIKVMKGLKKSNYEIKVMEYKDTYAFVAINPKIDAKESYASKLNKFNHTLDFAYSAFQPGQTISVQVPEQVAINDEREDSCEMIDEMLHATTEELLLIEHLQKKVQDNDLPYNGKIYGKIDKPNKFLVNSKPDTPLKLDLILQGYDFSEIKPKIKASLKNAEIAEIPFKEKNLELRFDHDITLEEIFSLLKFLKTPPDDRESFSVSISADLTYEFKKQKNHIVSAIIQKIEL